MKRPLSRLLVVTAAAMGVLPSCDNVNDERIPYAPVYITFTTEAEWRLYGTPAASDVRRFIKSEKLPARFPYTAMSETGFGGVMLVCDALGENRAFDLACPVEVSQKVRIYVPEGEINAQCPVCGSTYDIMSGYGHPLSGPAQKDGYWLKTYRVSYTGRPLEYIVVTR
ncbi:MAG: hypothetical protein K2L30_03925 [Duncaniella sp.]|nr:hypothetical protein [Duncaniella sp.]